MKKLCCDVSWFPFFPVFAKYIILPRTYEFFSRYFKFFGNEFGRDLKNRELHRLEQRHRFSEKMGINEMISEGAQKKDELVAI